MNSNSENLITSKELKELLEENWSNAACYGYVIKACEKIGLSECDMKKIIKQLKLMFEKYTVEEAKKIYYKSNV